MVGGELPPLSDSWYAPAGREALRVRPDRLRYSALASYEYPGQEALNGKFRMNGVHDIGGTDGFGPVQRELNERVFHEPWEGRVWATAMSGAGAGSATPDAGRHQIELMGPVQYLTSSYYERWLAMLEGLIVRAGTLSRDEIEAKIRQFSTSPDLPLPRREDAAVTEQIITFFRAGNPFTRTVRKKPRFAVGDRVVTRNLNPRGHTRFPRYTRNKCGLIVAHHGAHVFPDTNAHGLGENPQHLYTIRISARELWGDTAEPNECLLIDLWESYLEPDGPDTKERGMKLPAKAKVAKPKSSVRSFKSARTKTKSAMKKGR